MKKLIAILSIIILLLPNVNINAKTTKPKLKQKEISVYLEDYTIINIKGLFKNYKSSTMKITMDYVYGRELCKLSNKNGTINPIKFGTATIKIIVKSKKTKKKLFSGNLKIRIGENGILPDMGETFNYKEYDDSEGHHYIVTQYIDGNFTYENHYINDKLYSKTEYNQHTAYYDENGFMYLDHYYQDYGAQMEYYVGKSKLYNDAECHMKTHILTLLSDDLPYNNFERLDYDLKYTNNDQGLPIKIEAIASENNFKLMTGIYTYDEEGYLIDVHWYGANGKEWTFDVLSQDGQTIEVK